MTKDDTKLIDSVDIPAALGLLTRLPVYLDTQRAMDRGARAAWAYPLVGVILGVVAAALVAIAVALGIPSGIIAGLVLAFGIVVTGAMHEDGLADAADGLWGGWDKGRRLEIMKDSHIGVYGVCAIGLSLLIRWSALVAIIATGTYWMAFIAVGALSRASMVAVMGALPNARSSGLSRHVGRPPTGAIWLALGIGAGAAVAMGLPGIILVGLGATLACAMIARAKVGGQTGDILGATQQVNEMALLVAVVVSVT